MNVHGRFRRPGSHGLWGRFLILPAYSADLNPITLAISKRTVTYNISGRGTSIIPSPGSKEYVASFRQVNAETTSAAGQTSHAVAPLVGCAPPTRGMEAAILSCCYSGPETPNT